MLLITFIPSFVIIETRLSVYDFPKTSDDVMTLTYITYKLNCRQNFKQKENYGNWLQYVPHILCNPAGKMFRAAEKVLISRRV